MANEFVTLRNGLNAAAAEAFQANAQLDQAQALINQALATLTNLPTKYGSVATGIDNQVTANPTNQAWLNLQDEKNNVVSDFTSYKTRATNLQTAVAGL